MDGRVLGVSVRSAESQGLNAIVGRYYSSAARDVGRLRACVGGDVGRRRRLGNRRLCRFLDSEISVQVPWTALKLALKATWSVFGLPVRRMIDGDSEVTG
jgi:hypothetical protein